MADLQRSSCSVLSHVTLYLCNASYASWQIYSAHHARQCCNNTVTSLGLSWHGNSYPDSDCLQYIYSEVAIRLAVLRHKNWFRSVNGMLLMVRWLMATQSCRVDEIHLEDKRIMVFRVCICRFQGARFCAKKGNALHETWACIHTVEVLQNWVLLSDSYLICAVVYARYQVAIEQSYCSILPCHSYIRVKSHICAAARA